MSQSGEPKPALWDALSVLLPTPEQTLLLRCCLQSGETARQAWEQWQTQTGGLQEYLARDGGPGKRLLPLLYYALRRNNAVIEPDVLAVLKNGYVREQLRYEDYRRILAEQLGTLASGGVRAIVLKGAALAETVYPEPALRHSHDIDLLVEPRDLPTAVKLLVSSGLRTYLSGNGAIPYEVLCHSSGLAVGVFTDLVHIPYYANGDETRRQELWSSAQQHNFGGTEGFIFSPAVNLLQVLGHASYSASRKRLAWACDAWFLTGSPAGPDWNFFLALAKQNNLTLPLAVMLSYLAQALNAPIPMTVLQQLKGAAAQTERLGYEIALGGARKTPNGRIKNMLARSSGWRERIRVLKYLCFPSMRYLEMTQSARHPRLLPLYYLMRPLRYLKRR